MSRGRLDDHVSKPIDPDELFATLLRWIKPRTRKSSKSISATEMVGQPAPPDIPDSDSLEITGIGMGSALRRTGGHRMRYESLLSKFADPFAEGFKEIGSALTVDDNLTAGRAAHSLKGATANLGETSLAELAAKTETAISTSHGIDAALTLLAPAFDAVVGAIRSALLAPPVTVETFVNLVIARKALNHLKTYLCINMVMLPISSSTCALLTPGC